MSGGSLAGMVARPARETDAAGSSYARPHPAAGPPPAAHPGASRLDWHAEVRPRAAVAVPDTPVSGTQVTVSYAVGGTAWPQTDMLTAGQVLDVIPGSPLETALGANITSLTATQRANELNGSDGAATSNV